MNLFVISLLIRLLCYIPAIRYIFPTLQSHFCDVGCRGRQDLVHSEKVQELEPDKNQAGDEASDKNEHGIEHAARWSARSSDSGDRAAAADPGGYGSSRGASVCLGGCDPAAAVFRTFW